MKTTNTGRQGILALCFVLGVAVGWLAPMTFHNSSRPPAAAANRFRLFNTGTHIYRIDSTTGDTWEKYENDWLLIGAPDAPITNSALAGYEDLPMATNAGVRGVDYFDEDNAAPLAPTNLVQTSKPEPKP